MPKIDRLKQLQDSLWSEFDKTYPQGLGGGITKPQGVGGNDPLTKILPVIKMHRQGLTPRTPKVQE